jgi:GTPase involved in cell partitioning and DNA repair
MNNIKVLRLQSGEDIIGLVDISDENYKVTEPMTVGIESRGKYNGLVMHQWIPVQLVKNKTIVISKCDVMFAMEPTEEFTEYYNATVEKINKVLKKQKEIEVNDIIETTDDEFEELMEAFNEMEQDGHILH